MVKKTGKVYQIKATLRGIHPPIWRRFQVSANISLGELHDILQIVMGWTDSHLHEFRINEQSYGMTGWDDWDPMDVFDELDFKIGQLIELEGQKFQYQYDFGDSWEHTLVLEKIFEEKSQVPVCLKGKRACPPEDVGGTWGYEEFLLAIETPSHPEHKNFRYWAGGDFDPEKFDIELVNKKLSRFGVKRPNSANSLWPYYDEEIAEDIFTKQSAWSDKLSKEFIGVAESLPLRKDMISFLSYIQDHKVTGTQSTGNFPLKAVREICARFIEPIELDHHIGEQIFKLRSESEVMPLRFRHLLAAGGGLIDGGSGRRWKITPYGEKFLEVSPARQVWLLATIWWARLDWSEIDPFGNSSDPLPWYLYKEVNDSFLDLPIGKPHEFELFADKVIERIGLVPSRGQSDTAQDFLRVVVWYMILYPQVELGIIRPEYRTEDKRYSNQTAIVLTPFGLGLLDALRDVL